MRMMRHVVLINWKANASKSEVDQWVELCNQIPDECSMVYNWFSSYSVPGPETAKPSSHDFCVQLDLRSMKEWDAYIKHPFPGTVYSEGMKVIDLDRTASTNIAVETEPTRQKSRVVERCF
jgi:hypothetical protein